MQYYIELYREYRYMFFNVELFLKHSLTHNVKRSTAVIILALLLLMIVTCSKLMLGVMRKRDTRIATAAFWVVLILITFGYGGIVYLMLEMLMEHKMYTYDRGFRKWPYMVLPSLTVFITYYLEVTGVLPVRIDISLNLVAGVAVVILEILIISLSKHNKAVSIMIPAGKAVSKFAAAIGKDERVRRAGSGSVKCSIAGKAVLANIVASEDLKNCLLLTETRDMSLIKKYKRPNGTAFNVVEKESLVVPKVSACIAGLMLMIMTSTPYIPMVVNSILAKVNGGII